MTINGTRTGTRVSIVTWDNDKAVVIASASVSSDNKQNVNTYQVRCSQISSIRHTSTGLVVELGRFANPRFSAELFLTKAEPLPF